MGKEPSIEVPLPEYVKQAAQEAGREAAQLVLKEHMGQCPIVKQFDNMVHDVWGNGKPGIKQDLVDTRARLKAIEEAEKQRVATRRGFISDWVRPAIIPLVSALLAGACVWLAVTVATVAKTASAYQQTTTQPAK